MDGRVRPFSSSCKVNLYSDQRSSSTCIKADLQHIQALFRGNEGTGFDEDADNGELREESDMVEEGNAGP